MDPELPSVCRDGTLMGDTDLEKVETSQAQEAGRMTQAKEKSEQRSRDWKDHVHLGGKISSE